MKRFPISSPPEDAGIYALTNSKTGHIYIGRSVNLRRRYAEWKGALVQRIGVKNKRFFDAIEGSAPGDWEFLVVLEMPGADDDALAIAEQKAITQAANRRPNDVLNFVPQERKARLGNVRLSTITDEAGRELSYSEASALLGCSTETLGKRLRKYRTRGVTTIGLDTLRERTEKYRGEAAA